VYSEDCAVYARGEFKAGLANDPQDFPPGHVKDDIAWFTKGCLAGVADRESGKGERPYYR
jgi:hypothetical protein